MSETVLTDEDCGWEEFRNLVESRFIKACRQDPADAPMPLVDREAAIWTWCKVETLRWVLEMMPEKTVVFRLKPTGRYVRGEAEMANAFTIRIEPQAEAGNDRDDRKWAALDCERAGRHPSTIRSVAAMSDRVAERVRYYDTMKPYVVVDEAGGGWEWKMYDPRKRTPKGGPVVMAERSADTRDLAYIVATSELVRAADAGGP